MDKGLDSVDRQPLNEMIIIIKKINLQASPGKPVVNDEEYTRRVHMKESILGMYKRWRVY